MTGDELKLTMLKTRLAIMMERGDKNIKCPGVARKLRRKIRNLSMKVGSLS